MDRIFDVRVTITVARRTRTFSAVDLEAATGVELRPTLLRLVLDPTCPQPVHEEEGGKGVDERPRTVTVSSKPFQTVGTPEGGSGETTSDAIDREAVRLADALDDWKSLAFFRRVVTNVPPEVIREALAAALDVPRRDVRRSRGAYFAAVLRRLQSAHHESP